MEFDNSDDADSRDAQSNNATSKTFDWSRQESVPLAVVEAVGEQTETDPTDLPPLHGVVDPDGLDSLFDTNAENDSSTGRVVFEYHGCRVIVSGDGTVAVYRL